MEKTKEKTKENTIEYIPETIIRRKEENTGIKIFLYEMYKSLDKKSLEKIAYVEGESLEEVITKIYYEEEFRNIGLIKIYDETRILAEMYLKKSLRVIKELKEKNPEKKVTYSSGMFYIERKPIKIDLKQAGFIKYY